MINFYKEDNIGKIAFASGDVYAPEGNVSVILDATTKQILVAEDNKVLYYVPLSNTLQVNGDEITGTDAEKLALIAPIFQNAGGGGTGGGDLQQVTDAGNFTSNELATSYGFGVKQPGNANIDLANLWKTSDGSTWGGSLSLKSIGGVTGTLISKQNLSTNRTYELPDKDGTIALISDISGGSSTTPKLLSPDNTTWTLGVTNEGALTVTSGGTGGSESFTLNSPDGATWTITISNEGVLSQTKP